MAAAEYSLNSGTSMRLAAAYQPLIFFHRFSCGAAAAFFFGLWRVGRLAAVACGASLPSPPPDSSNSFSLPLRGLAPLRGPRGDSGRGEGA
jgi:hypothetical protein